MACFPEKLIDGVVRDGRIWPRYLTERDAPWVEALQDFLLAQVGQRRQEMEQQLGQQLARGRAGRRAKAALAHLLVQLHGFDKRGGADPVEVRRILFDEAALAPPSSARSSIVAAASTRLGQPPEAIEEALYGDLPGERRLAPLPHPPSVSELLERYNLTLAQSLLLRAESVQAQMDGLAKAVLRYARLQQLICTVEAPSEGSGRATIHLSGPLSLFRGTTKYGRALACWLPALSRAPSWSLRATCLLGAGPVVFAASHRDPIGTTHVAVRRFDSKVEERFFRDLQRLGSRWVVLREADPVGAGARLVCPDFTLIDAGRGLRVAVEIVGFWTPAYLRDKVATLAALPPGTRWLLCVDAALAAAEVEALPRLAPVFPFRGRIPAAEFLAFVERAVGAWTTRSPCDHPRSP